MASGPFEPRAADLHASSLPLRTLSANVVAFCSWLRKHCGFLVGPGEERDALRAAALAGIDDPARTRRVLRLVLTSKPEEIEVFDEIFDAFFLHPRRGRPQPLYAPRHTRESQATTSPGEPGGDSASAAVPSAEPRLNAAERHGEPMSAEEATQDKDSWQTLLARYSPDAGRKPVPGIAAGDVRQHLTTASKLVTSVHLGHVRRWRPQVTGRRFDVRRTLRASLHTGGDPVALRFLGHPLRNPRFVLLIDGSRSMSGYGHLMLAFAYALVQRSRRAHVFIFSSALADITGQLRSAIRLREHRVTGVDEAWGGGTRIGDSLSRFVSEWGARLLDDQTIVLIYSDGFDVGDVRRLERAMHEIHRRSAGVIWVNPLAGTRGYTPDGLGMRACLPFIDALVGVRDAHDLARVAAHAAAVSR